MTSLTCVIDANHSSPSDHHCVKSESEGDGRELDEKRGQTNQSIRQINQSINQSVNQPIIVGYVVINVLPVVIVHANYLSAEQEARDVLLAGPLLSIITISISIICLVIRSNPRPDTSVEVNTAQHNKGFIHKNECGEVMHVIVRVDVQGGGGGGG